MGNNLKPNTYVLMCVCMKEIYIYIYTRRKWLKFFFLQNLLTLGELMLMSASFSWEGFMTFLLNS